MFSPFGAGIDTRDRNVQYHFMLKGAIMRRFVFIVLLLAGCTAADRAPDEKTPAPAARVPSPAAGVPSPSRPAPPEKPLEKSSTTPGASAKAPTPTLVPVPAPAKPPTPTPVPSPSTAAASASAAASAPAKADSTPHLDLATLEKKLKETKAIGTFTKLALKNEVDDLLDKFRAYYQGKLRTTLNDLRPPFELLMMKVLSLLQNDDPTLASEIARSRESIWGILADRNRFSTLT
jgi:hypothetical protein